MPRRPQGAGGLRERNGRWQSSTRDPRTGKTLWRTWPHGTTRRQAEHNHREWCAEISKRRPADRTLTVAGYLTTWLAIRAADMSDATHARHTANVRILDRELGNVRLAELEPLTLQGLFAKLAGSYSARTVRSIASTASLAFGDAVRWGRLPTNPMAAVRLPRPPVGADEAITPHAVRHWFVSTWMAQGLPAQTIAEHCGHSIAEVLRRYGKHAPASALAEVATRMPRRSGG